MNHARSSFTVDDRDASPVIEGTLHGRTGTFVLLHAATGSQGENHGSWTIAPASGGCELAGIRGGGEITDQHDFVLEYEVDA